MKKKIENKGELIHVKLEYGELIQTKKDMLSLEMALLKIVKSIRKYRFLRSKELEQKQVLYAKFKDANTNLKKLQTTFPKPKIPEFLKKDKLMEEEEKFTSHSLRNLPHNDPLESELQEIQNRLKELAR